MTSGSVMSRAGKQREVLSPLNWGHLSDLGEVAVLQSLSFPVLKGSVSDLTQSPQQGACCIPGLGESSA